ncbi:MAG: hypothetical protein AAGM36_14710 [Cyanobacteria bacterium J06597_1]
MASITTGMVRTYGAKLLMFLLVDGPDDWKPLGGMDTLQTGTTMALAIGCCLGLTESEGGDAIAQSNTILAAIK